MDPYRVLGLEPGASQAEIKRAYRRLAKTLHPDFAGERSIDAFLAVQDAYEQLTGERGSGRGAFGSSRSRAYGYGAGAGRPASAPRSGGGWQEPWRADPDRARAAREQAKARRAGGFGQPSGPADSTTRRTGSSSDASAAGGPRDRGDAGSPGANDANGAKHASGRAGASGRSTRATGGAEGAGGAARRRRASRKATLGSTSYDEAREAADARWAGASWYGPSTGEYWIVNPREYADPRKHGPGYSSRGRTAASPRIDVDAPEAGGPGGDGGHGTGGRSEETRGARDEPAASRDWTADATFGTRRRRAFDPEATEASERRARASTGASTGGADRAAGRTWPEAAPGPGPAPTLEGAIRSLLAGILRAGPTDPVHHLGLALLAWPPIGLAVADVIGRLTGCATYAVTCSGSDPLLPWLAQAAIVGVLLLATPLARLLAAGTVALVIGLVPATAFLIAFGGAGTSGAGGLLAAFGIVAWLIGVGWALRSTLHGRAETARPNEDDFA